MNGADCAGNGPGCDFPGLSPELVGVVVFAILGVLLLATILILVAKGRNGGR